MMPPKDIVPQIVFSTLLGLLSLNLVRMHVNVDELFLVFLFSLNKK